MLYKLLIFQGFEARGTTLAQRLTAWVNLIEATHPRGELVENPLEYYYYLQYHNQPVKFIFNYINLH